MADKNNNPSGTAHVHSVPLSPITDRVMTHIRITAQEMTRHCNFSVDDFDDICQDLAVAVIKAFSNYDCSRSGYYTYAQTIVNRTRNAIYRERIRKGMDCAMIRLDSINPESPVLIDEGTLSPRESLEQCERSEKISRILNSLPAEVRKAVLMFADGYSISDVTAECGFTFSQYYRRILPELQAAFKKI